MNLNNIDLRKVTKSFPFLKSMRDTPIYREMVKENRKQIVEDFLLATKHTLDFPEDLFENLSEAEILYAKETYGIIIDSENVKISNVLTYFRSFEESNGPFSKAESKGMIKGLDLLLKKHSQYDGRVQQKELKTNYFSKPSSLKHLVDENKKEENLTQEQKTKKLIKGISKYEAREIPELFTLYNDSIEGLSLRDYYKSIDQDVYKKVEILVGTLGDKKIPSRKRTKNAKSLLQKIEHLWGHTNYPLLKPVHKIANAYNK